MTFTDPVCEVATPSRCVPSRRRRGHDVRRSSFRRRVCTRLRGENTQKYSFTARSVRQPRQRPTANTVSPRPRQRRRLAVTLLAAIDSANEYLQPEFFFLTVKRILKNDQEHSVQIKEYSRLSAPCTNPERPETKSRICPIIGLRELLYDMIGQTGERLATQDFLQRVKRCKMATKFVSRVQR